MTINPNVSGDYYLQAALAIDAALERLDPERHQRTRRLGGAHEPLGGPALKFERETLVFLAEALAGAFEAIDDQQKRIEKLEREVKALSKKAEPTK